MRDFGLLIDATRYVHAPGASRAALIVSETFGVRESELIQ